MKRMLIFIVALFAAASFSFSAYAESADISYGREYSLVTPASEAYPDDGLKLTDGIYGTHAEGTDGYYASGAYVGFNKENVNANGNFAVILDLGKVYDNIVELSVGYLSETSVGISAPESITFSAAEERNGNYSEIGTVQTTPENADTSASYAKSLHPENPARGRFIMVTIKPAGYTDKNGTASIAPWTFIDEINIQAASAPTGEGSAPNGDNENSVPENESSVPNDNSSVPENSDNSSPLTPTDDEIGDTPQTGDNGITVFAFVLLALSAVTMAIALFTRKRNKQF